jgi:3-methyladenine DNA glycosylase AlkD
MSFINALETALREKSNPENAFAMAKYMRNHFSFFGMKTEKRRIIFYPKSHWMGIARIRKN